VDTNIDYTQLMDTYLSLNPHRQQAYFRFLANNKQGTRSQLACRFLRGEFIQSKCSSFAVVP
jgi:hypothetical protein